jgi:hypothetical protein
MNFNQFLNKLKNLSISIGSSVNGLFDWPISIGFLGNKSLGLAKTS